MESIRKWFYRPKRDDTSLLAQFFYADESLNGVACELDSFDGRQEPERCTSLVNQLRHCQDRVLTICNQIMDELIPDARANRDFRVKFPDDVMQENLAGQLWFGAECLAAGSSILNREAESSAMRPLAKALTKSLEIVRNLLREHALKGQMNLKAQNPLDPSTEKLIESLKIFDRLFADFELCYVGAMVPVKSTKEYEQQELVCVLFSETLQRALERGLLNQADVDNYEPALMFTIPRLAIVAGLLAPPGGPLCLSSVDSISEMFRPFRTLLLKIRDILWTLNSRELYMLENLLCSIEEPSSSVLQSTTNSSDNHEELSDLEKFVQNFYTGYPNCKDFIAGFYTVTRNNGSNNMDEIANDALLILDQEKQVTDNKTYKRSSYNTRKNSIEVPVVSRDPKDSFIIKDTATDSGSSSSTENFSDNQNPDISQVLGNAEEVSVPQTQYLLNQVSHENSMTNSTETIQIDSPHSEESKTLITEANKTLSNLLLDNDCQNEISEHTDSGICTVISSENTSLYDKSPEEEKDIESESKKLDEEEHHENTSYSCSNNLNSPLRKDSSETRSRNCVCKAKNKIITKCSDSTFLKSTFNGLNEEIIGIAYGPAQIPVCDGNQGNLQINYSENWENLNSNMDNTSSTNSNNKEFWNDLKCQNCPSTSSRNFDKVGKKIEKMAKQKMLMKREIEEKLRKRNRRKHDRRDCVNYDSKALLQLPTSTESSRSNSTDRLNPRLVNFGSSLHPSQNTRQMPNFGSCNSSRSSPKLQHYEVSTTSLRHRHHHISHNVSQSRKLLDHRRSRSEHIHRMKKRDNYHNGRKDKLQCKLDYIKRKNSNRNDYLMNDGFGPRTNRSGLVCNSNETYNSFFDVNKKSSNIKLKTELDSSSSGSSFYDTSSETSEFHSDCQDDEEIALAMQAAEIANRNQIRAKFRSPEDLVHRLFVCIAGVADQLQTNFASDLRNILKCVFLMNSSQIGNDEQEEKVEIEESVHTSNDLTEMNENANITNSETLTDTEVNQQLMDERLSSKTEQGEECIERAPVWIPDNDAPRCMACEAGFTVVRRRHHCRNCGKVFCGRCSSNNVPLPKYGHAKPVRVCNRCFLYQVTPFTVAQMTTSPS